MYYVLQHNPSLLTCKSTAEGFYSFDVQKAIEANHLNDNEMPVLPKTSEEGELKEKEKLNDKPTTSTVSNAENKSQINSHSYLKNIGFRRNSVSYHGIMHNKRALSCPNVYRLSVLDETKDEVRIFFQLSGILSALVLEK